MTAEIGRWLIALGAVAAAVGFTVLGMSMAYVSTVMWQKDVAIGLMAGGAAAVLIGVIMCFAAGVWKPVTEDERERVQR